MQITKKCLKLNELVDRLNNMEMNDNKWETACNIIQTLLKIMRSAGKRSSIKIFGLSEEHYEQVRIENFGGSTHEGSD